MFFSYYKIRIQWFLAWAAFCGLCAHHAWLTFGLGGAQGRQGPDLLRQPQQPDHNVDTAHHAGTLLHPGSKHLAWLRVISVEAASRNLKFKGKILSIVMAIQMNHKKLQQFGMVLVTSFNYVKAQVKLIAAREGISRVLEELLKGGKCVLRIEFESWLKSLIEPYVLGPSNGITLNTWPLRK